MVMHTLVCQGHINYSKEKPSISRGSVKMCFSLPFVRLDLMLALWLTVVNIVKMCRAYQIGWLERRNFRVPVSRYYTDTSTLYGVHVRIKHQKPYTGNVRKRLGEASSRGFIYHECQEINVRGLPVKDKRLPSLQLK